LGSSAGRFVFALWDVRGAKYPSAQVAPRRYAFTVGLAACITLGALTSGSLAGNWRVGAIEPGTRVNGMLVVQGDKRDADGWLFDTICDPIVLRPGRRTRTCGQLPPLRRIFVGYGSFAPERQIDAYWRSLSWSLWIDGKRVGLGRFGHADRRIQVGGRDVVLREWSIILMGAEGRHSIRYRTRGPQGVGDTTWRFSVAKT
jgi:hypothetical protein